MPDHSKKLTDKDILHLAKLANLSVSSEEIRQYETQLEETIDYVHNLSELDTTNVSTTAQTTELSNVFFEDGQPNTRGLTPEEATGNSSTKDGDYFKVKKIM